MVPNNNGATLSDGATLNDRAILSGATIIICVSLQFSEPVAFRQNIIH